MNQKITIQELADSIAAKHGMNKKEAEQFVRGIFELIEEALATEKYVKVKGLGTFKLIDVDSRESIDVNSGVRIEIQGHRKVSFLPEAGLKELINKPFSHFETVLLNENALVEDGKEGEFKKSWEGDGQADATPQSNSDNAQSEQASQPISEVAESNTDSISEKAVAEELLVAVEAAVPEEVAETEIDGPVDLLVNETILEPVSIEAILPENNEQVCNGEIETIASLAVKKQDNVMAASTEIVDVQPVVTPVVSVGEESTPVVQEDSLISEKKKNWVPMLLVVLLVVVGALVYFFTLAKHDVTPTAMPVDQPALIQDDAVQDSVIVTEVIEEETESISATEVATSMLPKPTVTPEKAYSITAKYEIVGTKVEYTIQRGESLSMVAIKFYGLKEFWTYLVQHNREVITNPDNVPFDTTIRIPELRAIAE